MNITEKLRQETAVCHKEIERKLSGNFSPLTLEKYLALLQKWYGFIVPWETAITSLLSPLEKEFFTLRKKLPLITEDLSYFSFSPEALKHIPLCPMIPSLSSVSRALGSLYVIEGSTMGGQLIARQIEETLGLEEGKGYSFYKSYGRNTKRMWDECKQFLTQHERPDEVDQSIAAAQETFAVLGEWLKLPHLS